MPGRKYIHLLKGGSKNKKAGNKARSVLFLRSKKFRVPLTYVVSYDAHDEFRILGNEVIERLRSEIRLLPDRDWAVRSSTNIEDSSESSFAGLFQTITDVKGDENILNAIRKVWDSTLMNSLDDYRSRTGSMTSEIKCAVMIQEMVRSELSGVSFSLNPVTGLRETIVEAVEGQGENLVQKGITPLRWRFRQNQIIEGNEQYKFYNVIEEVVKSTESLKKICRENVDIEWAYDGTDIYYLQVREITGKRKINIYSNRMAREMLPGQIKPLVWSVNIPLVNGTWIRLLSEITGHISSRPEDLARSFYYRTYFNMNALGDLFREFGMSAESLETVLLGHKAGMPAFRPGLRTLKHTGRIIRFIWRKLHFEPFLIMEYSLLKKKFESLRVKISNSDPFKDFGSLYDELFKEGGRLAYLNIIVPILMQIYHRNLRKKLKKAGYDYDTLNFTEDYPRLKEFSPVYSMNNIRDDFERLPDEIKIKCNSFSALKEVPEAKELLIKIEDFISSFGHHSSSGNDFSYKKWEEEPELVFSMIINSQPGKSQEERPDFSSLRQSGLRKRKLGKAYMKAGKFLLYREMISSLYIFGYGQFRLLFLQTGKELVKNGIIDDSEDIFYFTMEELIKILEDLNGNKITEGREVVLSRKKEMADCENMAMPSVIFGDDAPIPETDNVKNLKGTGTSPGTCRGITKIVRGTWDFSSVNQGDVIIIPFSDVSWSPVLLKAGAIVSESGGMLSHCSIIAREMGIPAMVSVDNACQLHDGIEVTVDGSNGILTIH